MNIERIEFISSSPSLSHCPKEEVPEFAFIGRSNVGKSSLINMLAGTKGLAKVSGTPGKTRMVNHFRVFSSGFLPWHLVDLPGYGFARASKTLRRDFDRLIRNYLEKRETLALIFVLIDSRLEPQQNDLDFIDWLGETGNGFVMLFTKTDKLSASQLGPNLEAYRRVLREKWEELPAMIATSAKTRAGREEVLETIGMALREIGHAGKI